VLISTYFAPEIQIVIADPGNVNVAAYLSGQKAE